MTITLLHKNKPDELTLKELLDAAGVRNIAGNCLLLIHPRDDEELEEKTEQFAIESQGLPFAVIPYSADRNSAGSYSVSTGHDAALRVFTPSTVIGKLLELRMDVWQKFMAADWRGAVPWSLLFPITPYASLSLRLAATVPSTRDGLEASLAPLVRSEAASFGIQHDENPLALATAVLAAWSR